MPTVLFIAPETRLAGEALTDPTHGSRVYDARPVSVPAKDPDEVYMLYLSARDGGYFRRQYRTKRGSATADATAKDLCDRAKVGDTKFEIGKDLVGIKWESACHLYIVVDIQNCRFEDDQSDNRYDPLRFHGEKKIPGTNATFHYDRNAAFYDGSILANNVLNAPGFHCINHLTDEHGEPLLHPRLRTYGFEIRYVSPAGLEIVDPDGQNQGPPA